MVQTHTTTVGHTPAPRTLRYTPPADHFVAVPTTSNFTGGGSGIARGMALHEVSKTDCNKGCLQTIFSRRTHTYVLTDMCGATTWCPFVKCSHAAAHPVDGKKLLRAESGTHAQRMHTRNLYGAHFFLTLFGRFRPVLCFSISHFEGKAPATFLFQITFRYDCIIFEWSLLPLTTRQPYAASTASSNASRSKGTVSCALTTMRSRSRFSVAMTVFFTQIDSRGKAWSEQSGNKSCSNSSVLRSASTQSDAPPPRLMSDAVPCKSQARLLGSWWSRAHSLAMVKSSRSVCRNSTSISCSLT